MTAVLTAGILIPLNSFAKDTKEKESTVSKTMDKEERDKERLIGFLIRGQLERYHYTQKKMDDPLSAKAFDELIKRFDFGRQFFLQGDIDKLSKYKYLM